MCGIVGYVGQQEAAPILLDGLRRLEYRGYDSAGIAVCGDGQLRMKKSRGEDSTKILKKFQIRACIFRTGVLFYLS